MNYEMAKVVIEGFAVKTGFGGNGFICKHDIAEHPAGMFARPQIASGKGQYIGRPIDAAPLAVQSAHRTVAGEQQAQFRIIAHPDTASGDRRRDSLLDKLAQRRFGRPFRTLYRDFDGRKGPLAQAFSPGRALIARPLVAAAS